MHWVLSTVFQNNIYIQRYTGFYQQFTRIIYTFRDTLGSINSLLECQIHSEIHWVLSTVFQNNLYIQRYTGFYQVFQNNIYIQRYPWPEVIKKVGGYMRQKYCRSLIPPYHPFYAYIFYYYKLKFFLTQYLCSLIVLTLDFLNLMVVPAEFIKYLLG